MKYFFKYGIDFDSASNGVLLPYEKNSYVTTEAMHNGGDSIWGSASSDE